MFFECLSIWECEQNYSQYQEMAFGVYGPSFWCDDEGIKQQEEEKSILLQSSFDAVDNTYNFKDNVNGVYAHCPVRSKIKELLQQDDFRSAITTVRTLPQIEQSFVFRYMSKRFIDCGAIDEAIDTINRVPSRAQRAFAFKDLVSYLLHKENVEKAIQVSQKISLWCVRGPIEEEISRYLHLTMSVDSCISEKNFFHAVKIACEIPFFLKKKEILTMIFEYINRDFFNLLSERKFEEALCFALQIPLEDERREKIKSVFRHVGYDGVEPLKWVSTVSWGRYKTAELKEFCSVLVAEMQFGHAILVAYTIFQDREKGFVFEDIARALMGSDRIDITLLFINGILPEETRLSILYALFEALLKARSIDTICDIASKIPNEFDKGHIFLYLSRYAMSKFFRDGMTSGFLERAVKIACSISINSIKLKAIQYIFLMLRNKGTEEQKQRILEITRQMKSELEKSLFLLGIVDLFLEDNMCRKAYAIACEISLEKERSKALQQVLEYSIAENFIPLAITTAETISDPEEKVAALVEISRVLVMQKCVKRAVRIIQRIPDKTKESAVLTDYSYKLIKEKRLKAATIMAKSIPDEQQRDTLMKVIEKKLQVKQEKARLRELFK